MTEDHDHPKYVLRGHDDAAHTHWIMWFVILMMFFDRAGG